MTPPAQPATTETITIDLAINATGHQVFLMNNSTFHADYNAPVLLLANHNVTSYPDHPEWNVHNIGSNSSARFILYNTNLLYHPIHMHGHNFWVLAEGNGKWDGTIVNPQNPQRRDIQILRNGTVDAPGFMVIEVVTDNPACGRCIATSPGEYYGQACSATIPLTLASLPGTSLRVFTSASWSTPRQLQNIRSPQRSLRCASIGGHLPVTTLWTR